jgi:hypothetical protein
MPAGSDPVEGTTVPVTFRPLGIRIATVVLGLLLVGVGAAVWFAFPQSVRDQFTLLQRLTLLGFALGMAAAGYALARCRVEARPEGLLTVNGFRSHLYAWGDVAGVTLRAGAPWAMLELADGGRAAAMGIQGSDGSRAVSQVRQLLGILDARHGPGEQKS